MKSFKIIFLCVLSYLAFSCEYAQSVMEQQGIDKNNEASELINEYEFEPAIALLREALKNSFSVELKTNVCRNLSIAFNGIDEIDSARFYSNMAANFNEKNSIDYLVNSADVDIMDGEVSKAIYKLEKIIKLDSSAFIVYNSLGLIYLGEYGDDFIDDEKAISYNKRAFEMSPQRVTQENLARSYYYTGDWENSENQFKQLVSQYPEDLDYSYYLGLTKYESGNLEEGKRILSELVQKDSTYYEGIEDILEEE